MVYTSEAKSIYPSSRYFLPFLPVTPFSLTQTEYSHIRHVRHRTHLHDTTEPATVWRTAVISSLGFGLTHEMAKELLSPRMCIRTERREQRFLYRFTRLMDIRTIFTASSILCFHRTYPRSVDSSKNWGRRSYRHRCPSTPSCTDLWVLCKWLHVYSRKLTSKCHTQKGERVRVDQFKS